LGKKNIVQNLLIFALDKIIYFKEQFFRGLKTLKNYLHYIKYGGDQLKTVSLFSKMLFLP
jgi:hypothetical protein